MTAYSAGPFGSRLLGPAGQDRRTLRIRIQLILTSALIIANLIGAGVVAALSVLVVPSARPDGHTLGVLSIATPIYLVLAIVVGAFWGTRDAFRALRWVTEERTPDADERRAALRVPLRLTVVQLTLWGLATVLFTVLAGLLQPSLVYAMGFTVGFAGVVVCANAYLLSEFALRPIAAQALSGAPPQASGNGVQLRMLLFWCLGTGVPAAGLVMVAVFALIREDVSAAKLATTVVVLGFVVIVFGMLLTVFTARAVVAPIRSVRIALSKIRHGDLDVEIQVYDGTELGLLQAGVNQMAAGLREREHIRDLFGKHVGEDVAAAALGTVTELGGEVREVSVLFVDVVGSTTIAATRPPTEVVELLNRFFAVVVDEVDRYDGLVNKFVGDAVLAIFGAPVELPSHADAALAAARAIAERLRAEVPDCEAGIGVATGPAVAGYVGDRRRFEYTVIGDPVNEAARLTELAKSVPGGLVASWRAIESTSDGEGERWRSADQVTLRGRLEETTVAVPR
ncbi:adenylate/guanylate cyclase domain-containing protein [Amycolatopsis sp. CA-230715]|uniref:adenylate/guanylate cyclase domain-containing protein n=1 Tax=Amycolatopsis sp. CA-230715 TaxID=2745196 RepID=UPI001C018D21|nr:adenylate/guanylate cyclase domain-containing protein [Amycolatopsis sp. CA-230715]QWF78621.1 hypothetical protein HUW46_02019 [Amycolatopsis sp. CA-230715]